MHALLRGCFLEEALRVNKLDNARTGGIEAGRKRDTPKLGSSACAQTSVATPDGGRLGAGCGGALARQRALLGSLQPSTPCTLFILCSRGLERGTEKRKEKEKE